MSRYYVIVRRLHLQKYSFQKNSKQFESDCLIFVLELPIKIQW